MKILHITKYLDAKYGGIETYTDSLCKALHKQYKKIDVISFGKKKNINKKKIIK